MVLVIPSHTTVITVSLITNIYLDWLRLLIIKVEPGVLSDWRKYEEVQSITIGDPLRSYTDLSRSQQVFKKFTNSHSKQQHFLLYPSIFFFNYTFSSNAVILGKKGLLIKFSGSHGLWVSYCSLNCSSGDLPLAMSLKAPSGR